MPSGFKHGYYGHRLYKTWASMKQRCTNSNSMEYHNYGGRGITVCERWSDVVNFIEDMGATWKEDLTLDRINVNGNYEPSNCRWVTRSDNMKNTRRKADKMSNIAYVRYDRQNCQWKYTRTFKTQAEAEVFAILIERDE